MADVRNVAPERLLDAQAVVSDEDSRSGAVGFSRLEQLLAVVAREDRRSRSHWRPGGAYALLRLQADAVRTATIISWMDLKRQLISLKRDLDAIDGGTSMGQSVSWAFNTLLADAKKSHPDHPVVTSMESLNQSSTAGSLRVLAGQLLVAIEP